MRATLRRLSVGILATVLATTALSACAASGPPSWDNTSDGPIYLVDNTTAAKVPTGSKLEWNDSNGIVLSASPIPSDISTIKPDFPAPTRGASDYVSFIAPVGSERTKTAWKTWDDPVALGGKGASLPSVWPGYLANGNPVALKSAGGKYSMGIAYMKDNDSTVVSAFYTTIAVDAGSGTWTFATPPTSAATKTP